MSDPRTRVYENFRDYLAARFANTAAIRTFVCSAPIHMAEADFRREGSARDLWHEILLWTQTHDKYAALVAQTVAAFPGDRTVVEEYATSWEAGVPAPPPKVNLSNPYPGLKPFEEKDHDHFFGREQWVRDIVAELGRHAFFCLYGGSGSGKSSLLAAGVIPRWRRETGGTVIHFTPGMDPFTSLHAMGLRNSSEAEPIITQARAGTKTDLFLELHRRQEQPGPMLVVMDQAEQLFTRTIDKDLRKRFLACLFAPLPDGVHLLVGMRNDYMDVWHTVLPPHLSQHLLLRPPTEAEARDIVIQPARRHHAFFEAGMAREILERLRNLEGPSPLPLLQFLLKELWKESPPQDGMLVFDTYRKLGGVDGALRKHIESFISKHPDRDTDIEYILLALVRFEEREGKYLAYAKAAPRAGLPQDLVDALLSDPWRLLTTSQEKDHIEFAHEVIMTVWPGFDAFKNKHGTLLSIRSDIIEDATAWTKAATRQAKRHAIWSGARLERALMHAALGPYDKQVDQFALAGSPLTKAERAFLLAGVEQQRQARMNKAIQTAMMMFLTFIALFLVLLTHLGQSRLAKRTVELEDASKKTNAVLAEASWKVGQEYRGQPYKTIQPSSILATHHLLRSALSAEKAGDQDARYQALLAARVTSADLRFAIPTNGNIPAIRSIGGNSELLSLDEHGKLFSMQIPDGKLVCHQRETGLIDWDSVVCFSDDGSQMLARNHEVLSIQDTLSGHSISPPFSQASPIASAAFSHSKSLLLCWGNSGDVSLRNGNTGAQIASLNNSGKTRGAFFGPGDRNILTWGDGDATPRLWSREGGRIALQTQRGVTSLSPGSFEMQIVESFGPSKTITPTLGSNTAGQPAETASTHPDSVQTPSSSPPRVIGAIFDPTGDQIASWDDQGRLSIWITNKGEHCLTVIFDRPKFTVRGATFNDSGTHILFWGQDYPPDEAGTKGAWIAKRVEPRGQDASWKISRLKDSDVEGAKFAPRSGTFATWGKSGNMKIWQEDQQSFTDFPQSHLDNRIISGVEFNNAGTAILSWTSDDKIELRDIRSRGPISRDIEHPLGFLHRIALFRESEFIVTASSSVTLAWRINSLLQAPPIPPTAIAEWTSEQYESYETIGTDIQLLKHASLGQIRSKSWRSPDGKRILGKAFFPGHLQQWQLSPSKKIGKPLRTLIEDGQYVMDLDETAPLSATFSPDGKLVMCTLASVIRIWRSSTSELLAGFSIYPFREAVFSADGKKIIIKDNLKQCKIVDIDFPRETPASRYILEFEVRSATTLLDDGRLQSLSFEQWLRKREILEAQDNTLN